MPGRDPSTVVLHEGEMWRGVRPDLTADAVVGETTANIYLHGRCIAFATLGGVIGPYDTVTLNLAGAAPLPVTILKERRQP
jgi:hypothetical protein